MNAQPPIFNPVLCAKPAREVRLAELWATVRRRSRLIVTTMLGVVALAAIYVLLVRPQFAATSEIMLDPRKSSVESSASVLSNLPADQPTILNQVEILTSHRFAGKVVDRFRLDRDPAFSTPGFAARLFGSDEDRREVAIGKLRAALKVTQAGFSSSIRITVTSADRKKAADIAAAMAAMYVDETLTTKAQASHQASQWLTQRVAELARQVRDAEAAVQKYKADHHITITAAGTSVLEQQVADLNSQLTLARTDYDDKAAKAGHAASLMQNGQLSTSPQVVASSLISTLRTQQAELTREIANLATKYGPNHPKMKELSAQRSDLDAKIAQETARIADSVKNDADTSRTHVASLQKSLRQIEDLSAREKQEAVELTALQSAAASARAMYQAFLTQYSQTENQQGILRPDAYVISASEVSETFGPQTKLLAILAAFPAGLLLGLALAFLTDRGGPSTPTRRASAPSRMPSPPPPPQPAPAAMLPEMGAGLRAADLVVTSAQSSFAVAVSRLLNGILPSLPRPAVLVVVSMAPGAGKTTLALALARTAAQSGIRSIVVDANWPSCHLGTLTGRSTSGGFVRQGSADDFINHDPLSQALVMAADPRLSGYESVLAPAVLTRLVAGFKSGLDLVVIAAPVLSDALAPPVLALADGVVLAVDGRSRAGAVPVRSSRPLFTVLTHAR